MTPLETGRLYDKIASRWDNHQSELTAGLEFVRRAITLCAHKGEALDVGCGSGGRIITALLHGGFNTTGVDVSEAMLQFAKQHHPGLDFIHDDICEWQIPQVYDLIIAWDSIFHVPYAAQGRVIEKLCGALAKQGIILFTAGGIDDEITGQMYGETFYYSSLTEEEYLKIMKKMGCRCLLLQRDQYPEEHVVFMGIKHEQISQ